MAPETPTTSTPISLPPEFEEVDIEQLQDQDGAFSAWGFSRLKVRLGDKIRSVKVRIQSVPQDEVDRLRKTAPRAPYIDALVDPANEDHRRLGVTQRGRARIPNFHDAHYQEAYDAWNVQFQREIVGRGVVSELRFPPGHARAGAKAEGPKGRWECLESMQLSLMHFAELAGDILGLTQWSEGERENFLIRSSASALETSSRE